MGSGAAAALRRVAGWRPDAAVVFGSGLESLPVGATVDEDLSYGELGWPCTAVPGHGNRLLLVRVPAVGSAGLRLALACGRPHGYEGWSHAELERPVSDLIAAGTRRVLLTNSCGGLRPDVAPGDIVVCAGVVDLQAEPVGAAPPRMPVCTGEEAVAVAGPQFETRAEVAWLAGHGAVVGMSAAPEVRAARLAGAGCCLLALVVNRAAAVSSHEDVLALAGRLAAGLSASLVSVLRARWPELT
jgi:purine-nucleoside phosphorylase